MVVASREVILLGLYVFVHFRSSLSCSLNDGTSWLLVVVLLSFPQLSIVQSVSG